MGPPSQGPVAFAHIAHMYDTPLLHMQLMQFDSDVDL
jgi:hypothetical protein